MIRFFAKIRRQLAYKNRPASPADRFLQYSRYAIGEIVLVVIGILIALQVNNWNQERLAKNKERQVLEGLLKKLQDDLDFNVWISEINKRSVQSMQVIRHSLEEDLPYEDSLKLHFSLSTFIVYPRLNGSVVEALKAEGLDLISNKALRDSIIVVYGWQKNWIADQKLQYQDFMMHAAKSVFNTRFEELWDAHFDTIEKSKMVPVDYEALKTDPEYLYLIRSLPNLNKFYIDWPANSTITRLKNLKQMIEAELE